MKHINLIFILLAVVASSALAQTVSSDTIATRLWRQVNAFPQEKLYTQTDRAEYTCGDTIWMRHHVVDALTGMPSYASRYVYVELVNPMGSMVSRVMMRQDENGAIYGYMPTTTDMPSGQYILRAYTRYMAGTTPDYLFIRSVRLRSVMENSVKITSHYGKSTVSLSFANPQTGEPIHQAGVKVSSADGDMAFTGNSDDGIRLHTLDIGTKQRCLLVEVGNYKEYVPLVRERIDLQLMPEGGHLVAGQRCRVAYKAVDATGLGIYVKATITDELGNVVAESKAAHCGMGFFYITAQPEHSYKMTCIAADGRQVSAILPKAHTDVSTLAVAQNNGRIMVGVLRPDASATNGNEWLIVHQGGAPLFANRVTSSSLSFSNDMFRDGIVHIVLADNSMNIISERLVFVWRGNEVYDSDEGVAVSSDNNMRTVRLSLPDSVMADCAVSVTDATTVSNDTANNIVSTLLLSQELKGYVEQPAWYFADRGRSGYLDLLMLTQGWRRYDIQKALKGNTEKVSIRPETSMSISGKVTSNVTTKGRKGSSVIMSSNRGGLVDETTTDDNGLFHFNNFEMPDSTGYMLMTRSAKGSTNSVLLIDNVEYPAVSNIITPIMCDTTMRGDMETMKRYADRIAMVNGGRVVFLPEVEVNSKRVPKTEYENLAKINGVSISETELMNMGNKSIFDVLRWNAYPGLMFDSSYNWFLYHMRPTYLVVDGTVWNTGDTAMDSLSLYMAQTTLLQSLRTRDVLQIDILKGAIVGTLPIISGNVEAMSMDLSAIVITTKGTTRTTNNHVALVRPLGYQRPAAFYNPKYQVPEEYSLRQTVYWNPSVRINNGKAVVRFMPNGAKKYRVTVEGVDKRSLLIHLEKETE